MQMVLVTGAAGFIGFHFSKKLLDAGYTVIGLDNFNDYYDTTLKRNRSKLLHQYDDFTMVEADLADEKSTRNVFEQYNFTYVVNLAAQAGVGYSIENPQSYIHSNLVGFANILEQCRLHSIEHLVYASSSSVYGANNVYPLTESQAVAHPMSLYAATKRANELMAHSYASLYQLPSTGLRFFTVYGPWGRPDMALFKFTKNIIDGVPIQVNNYGNMSRDFTYIDDIVEGIYRVMLNSAKPSTSWSGAEPELEGSYAPWKIYNIGRGQPVKLMDFVQCIENNLGIKAKINMQPMQAGDVASTCADTSRLKSDMAYQPSVSVEHGIDLFIDWYKSYYDVSVNV